MKIPEILADTAWEQPARERTCVLRAMVQYLIETGHVTEAVISVSLFSASQMGGHVGTTEQTVDDIINSVGAARLTLHLLHYKLGVMDDETRKRIIGLPLNELLQLGEALLGFQSLDDLKEWQRRHSPSSSFKRTRRVNRSKTDVKKKN